LSAELGSVGDVGGSEGASAHEVVRLVEAHSGVSDVLGSTHVVMRLAESVARHLEGGRAGSRFPLLRVLLRRGPVSAAECDALAREVVRLRAALASVAVSAWFDAPRPSGDPALEAAAPLSPAPPPSDAFPRRQGEGPPKTLADAFAWPLFVAEHVARLGGASRRGVRVEVGPESPAGSLRARFG
jgi:hypothetical protein